MKLFVLCLLALTFYPMEGSASDKTIKKLREVLKEVKKLKDGLKPGGSMLNTPLQDIEDCCSTSALQCFHSNLMKLNTTIPVQHKLRKSLRDPQTVKGVGFCASADTTTTNCQSCDLYPKREPKEFVNQLQSLIHKALSRLVS